MGELKIWERRIAGLDIKDPDLERRELISRFNRKFTRVLRMVPKSNRKMLFRLLFVMNRLYIRNKAINFKTGFAIGYEAGMRRGINCLRNMK